MRNATQRGEVRKGAFDVRTGAIDVDEGAVDVNEGEFDVNEGAFDVNEGAFDLDRNEIHRQLTVHLTTDECALLDEAVALLETPDRQEIIRVALKELVERQRFLSWVAAHEDRSGKA